MTSPTAPPSWLETYMQNLEERDQLEKSNEATIKAYTKLANRTATLEKAAREAQSAAPVDPAPKPAARIPVSVLTRRDSGRSPSPQTPGAGTGGDGALREDLTSANRKIASLQSKLDALQASLTSTQGSLTSKEGENEVLTKRVAALEREVQTLKRGLGDRDSELKESRRLAENAQDEMVTIEMQLNVAEERVKKVEEENKELVDRWMKEMGRRADEVNEGSGWRD